jgi:hypothetical protein
MQVFALALLLILNYLLYQISLQLDNTTFKTSLKSSSLFILFL